jgi:hypothetical protein
MQPKDQSLPADSAAPAPSTQACSYNDGPRAVSVDNSRSQGDRVHHLETRDLLNVTATSKEIQYMLQVPRIQRQLWKRQMSVKAGEDPHFRPLTEKQAQILLPDGLTIPEAARRDLWQYFENIEAGVPP